MCVNPSTAKCGYNSSTGKTTLILVLNPVLTGPSFPFAVAPGDCLDVDAHTVTVSACARAPNTTYRRLRAFDVRGERPCVRAHDFPVLRVPGSLAGRAHCPAVRLDQPELLAGNRRSGNSRTRRGSYQGRSSKVLLRSQDVRFLMRPLDWQHPIHEGAHDVSPQPSSC